MHTSYMYKSLSGVVGMGCSEARMWFGSVGCVDPKLVSVRFSQVSDRAYLH